MGKHYHFRKIRILLLPNTFSKKNILLCASAVKLGCQIR